MDSEDDDDDQKIFVLLLSFLFMIKRSCVYKTKKYGELLFAFKLFVYTHTQRVKKAQEICFDPKHS